jgi:hypothetical protein
MGDKAAAMELLHWAQNTKTNRLNWVNNWFDIAMSTTPEFTWWLETNLSNQNFNSPEIKQAVAAILARKIK